MLNILLVLYIAQYHLYSTAALRIHVLPTMSDAIAAIDAMCSQCLTQADLVTLVSREGASFAAMECHDCPYSRLRHVPVICLEEENFGVIFEYVSIFSLPDCQ